MLMIVGCQKATVSDRPPLAQAPPTVPTLLKFATPQPIAKMDKLSTRESSRYNSEPSAMIQQGVVEFPLPGEGHQKIKVGLLLPLSGPYSEYGKSMLRASQMAVFDFADDAFLIMPGDTFGTPDGAGAAGRDILARGAKLLLGPLFAESVASVITQALKSGVNMVAFSNNRAVAGDGSFLFGQLPREQVVRIVDYAHAQGVLRFASLAPDTPYGHQVVNDLAQAVANIGGTLTNTAFFTEDPDNIRQAVRQIAQYDSRRKSMMKHRQKHQKQGKAITPSNTKNTFGNVDFEALFVPSRGDQLKQIAAHLPFFDVDTSEVQLLGMGSWKMAGLGREPALVGAWFAAPVANARANFEHRYRALYGEAPDPLAVLAYDATALAAVLARASDGASFDTESLTSANGFAGAGSIFRFLPNGDVQRGLAILEVEPWGFGIRSPSPETFDTFKAMSN